MGNLWTRDQVACLIPGTAGHSASQPQSQISFSPAEPSFDEKPNCVKDWAVKAKPFSFLKQILNSVYFLWRIAIQDLNYMKFLQFHLYKILLINDLLKYIFLDIYYDDRMTVANLIEMEKCPIFNAESSNIPD